MPAPDGLATNKLSSPEQAGEATEPWVHRPGFHAVTVVGFVFFLLAACLGYPVGS